MIASHMNHNNYPPIKYLTSVFVPRFFGLQHHAVRYVGANVHDERTASILYPKYIGSTFL
jgi:hypothetical protein